MFSSAILNEFPLFTVSIEYFEWIFNFQLGGAYEKTHYRAHPHRAQQQQWRQVQRRQGDKKEKKRVAHHPDGSRNLFKLCRLLPPHNHHQSC